MHSTTTTITSTAIILIIGSVMECRVLWIHLLCLPAFDTLPFYHILFVSVFRPTWIFLYPPHYSLHLVCLAFLKFFPPYFYFLFPWFSILLFLLPPVLYGYLVEHWRFRPDAFDIEARRAATSTIDSYCWLVKRLGILFLAFPVQIPVEGLLP